MWKLNDEYIEDADGQPIARLMGSAAWGELIAMLPELVEAAAILNALAVPNRDTIPMVRKKLPAIDRLVRRAEALLRKTP